MTDAVAGDAGASTVSLLPVFVAKPEHSAELLDRLVALERASRADAGCIAYRVFRDEDRTDRFVLVEPFGVTRLAPVT